MAEILLLIQHSPNIKFATFLSFKVVKILLISISFYSYAIFRNFQTVKKTGKEFNKQEFKKTLWQVT